MAAHPADGGPADEAAPAARLARAWAHAVAGTSVVPMDRTELVALLHDLATQLLGALSAEVFDRAVVQRVGAALVEAHFTEAGSLESTLALLGPELLALARTPTARERLAPLQGAVAAGYAAALRDRTRREQQRISASAFAARVVAEQARWDSETRFRTVFGAAVIGIGVADTTGRIIEVNHALAEMVGHSEDALLSSAIWTFVHPDDVPRLWERVK